MTPSAAGVSPPELPPAPLAAAVVSKAPGDLTESLEVVVASRTGSDYALIVPNWMPRGDVLPAVGDRCLVAFDEDEEPWLIGFQPA